MSQATQQSFGELGTAVEPDQLFTFTDEDGKIAIDISGPLENPTLRDVSEFLMAAERRIRAAIIHTFLETEETAEQELGLLDTYPDLPLRVASLAVSSIKARVVLDGDEAAQYFRLDPPLDWKAKFVRRLAKLLGLAAVAVVSGTIGWTAAGGPLPSSVEQLRHHVEQRCGQLPPGSTITIKTPIMDIALPCGDVKSPKP